MACYFWGEQIFNQCGNFVTKTPGIYLWKRTGVVQNTSTLQNKVAIAAARK